MMKGLFGRKNPAVPDALLNAMPVMPQEQVTMGGGMMPQTPMQGEVTYTPQAQAIMSGQAEMPKPRGYWQGGDRFTGRDAIAGALAAIGDGLQNWAGGRGGAIENLMAPRVMQREMAAKQQLMAAQRAAELQDFAAQQRIKAQYREPTEFEQALTLAGIDPASPQGVQLAKDRAIRLAQGPDPILQGAPIPGGGSYTGPYAGYREAIGGMAQGAPDTLPPDFFDSAPAPQASPISNARTINRGEYNVMLQSMNGDQRRMNEWMRKNNVVVGN